MAAAMSAAPVLADTISYGASIPSQGVDLSGAALSFTDFDPSLGALTGVTLSLTATISNYYTVTGNTISPPRVTIDQYTDFSHLGAASPLNLSSFSLTVADAGNRIIGGPQISTAYNPVFSTNPPTGWTYVDHTTGGSSGPYIYWTNGIISTNTVSTPTYTTTASSGQLTYADPVLLSELTGSGTTPLFVTTSTYTGVVGYGAGGEANGSVALAGTITYDYTPAPIPGAILLFGPGLAGLAAIKRRFKR
jgi:hypothetical protein